MKRRKREGRERTRERDEAIRPREGESHGL